MSDAGDGTRWMTYAELAKVRGITKSSATRLAFRKGWPRQTGNDGQARVAVPAAAQISSPDSIPGITDAITPDIIHDKRDDEALTRERQRADQAEARADRAEAQATEARALAEQRVGCLMDAAERAARAEGQVEELRKALDETRRPIWRRLLGWD